MSQLPITSYTCYLSAHDARITRIKHVISFASFPASPALAASFYTGLTIPLQTLRPLTMPQPSPSAVFQPLSAYNPPTRKISNTSVAQNFITFFRRRQQKRCLRSSSSLHPTSLLTLREAHLCAAHQLLTCSKGTQHRPYRTRQ